jgi:hypothetical protein
MNLDDSIDDFQNQDWKAKQLKAAKGLAQTLRETTDRCLFHASAWCDSESKFIELSLETE